MPTLEWIGKDKVVNHHQEVPFRILDKKYTFNAENSDNMIIHGDNLLALKSLLPQYEGLIDCIYIDPPYNTGKKEGQWVYSDNVDDPRIKKWLGEVVGAEGEDLSRHDKWLCMMYPRLKLLHKLLSNEGIIFISIDDNELASLKLCCDEIFGSSNFIGYLSVEINPKGRKNSDFISISNDYWLEKGVRVGFDAIPTYKNIIENTPHVCFKVPTGGGKTFLACNSLKTIFGNLPSKKAKVVVWLVPSEAILTQTLKNLSNPAHPYRQKIESDFNGRVQV